MNDSERLIVIQAKTKGDQTPVDVRALEAALSAEVKGEVRFSEGDRHLYATDSSNYRQVPLGVVLPRDKEDLIATVQVCHRLQAPITLRGGGTGLAGQTTNRAVIVDYSKYLHEGIEIDSERRLARVSAGVVLDRLQEAAAPFGLRFGPDPSTHDCCTIGGMIGNNACGVRSVASANYGLGARTSDNLASMEILTADGEVFEVGPTSDEVLEAMIQAGGRRGDIYRQLRDLRDRYAERIRADFPILPRRVSGYNLDELLPENGFNVARALAGTEGSCVTILEATLHLIPVPRKTLLVALGFEDVFKAGDAVPEVLKHRPDGLEGMDDGLIEDLERQQLHLEDIKLLPAGRGWLLAELGAESESEVTCKAEGLCEALAGRVIESRILTDKAEQERVWRTRESGLGSTAHLSGQKDAWEGWEDTAVPPDQLGDYLRDFRKLLDKFGYRGPFYGHFGQGLVHTRLSFDLKTGPGIQKFREFIREGAALVVRHGGSLSGEHGDGQSRAEMLEIMYPPDLLNAFCVFKDIWDPQGIMNPGKVVRPYRIDENLRLGSDYQPSMPRTHFQFPEDRGSMAYATERCVGVGKCRKTEGGTMCPSYMATREEKHATRGRAHLLFELLRKPDLSRNDWQDETVKESLDLCLACKACKSECPVNVDMATYKAEFFAHYYEKRARPRAAYAMGLIMYWARLGSNVPRLANFLTQNKGFSTVAKWAGGVAQERAMPRLASPGFRSWFEARARPRREGPKVILWPDTFNSYFLTDSLKAAVRVLEHAGWQVVIPKKKLCCGRPLYDFGMLTHARRLLIDCLATLQPELSEGTPVVVLEPSCLSVFRDEARGLLPGDERARRLKRQSFTLAEFLQKYAPDVRLPKISRRAMVHAHCHHHAILKTEADRQLLDRLGLDWNLLDSGCCGMAGSFGFEAHKYNVSKMIAESRLLPAVRALPEGALLIADGFSCREQVDDLAGIRPLHLAEVIAQALPVDAGIHLSTQSLQR